MFKLLIWLFLAAATGLSAAAPVQTPHATAELVTAVDHARPGTPILVALRLDHEPEWHTYWKNPGDSGMPTRIAWTLPEGVQAGPIQWPAPERIVVGPLANYGYERELYLLTEIRIPPTWPAGKAVALAAKAEWLICKEVCLPGGASLSLDIPTATGPSRPSEPWGDKIEQVRRALPRPAPQGAARVQVTDRHIVIEIQAAGPAASAPRSLVFYPDDPDIIDNPSPQTLASANGTHRLALTAAQGFKGDIKTLSGLLVADPAFPGSDARAVSVSIPYPGGAPAARAAATSPSLSAADIRASAGRGESLGIAVAVVFAFAGGLILNLMPCVFPVVSIKVLGFVEQAHGDRADLRRHGLAFAAGILVCFWIVAGALLGLRASGEALGWGFQLQSPPIVAALAVLFFVLGLNLSGMFEIGMSLQSAAGSVRDRNGLTGAFLGGMLATAVATPCTAPFMGAALGFALTQPAVHSMVVFTALAVGMSLPYVLLSFVPALTRWLPRPGRWMETFKQLLAFPLYLTVVWLVWVLGQQLGMTAAARLLAGLVLVAAALWFWQRFGLRRRGVAIAGAAVFAMCAAWIGWPQSDAQAGKSPEAHDSVWNQYSDKALAEARAEGPVFVDFTAAWCVTCQVNKRVVLESDAVRQAFERSGVRRMRADWTNRDDHITRALERLGRSGVPVYALYPKGTGEPQLLPELLSRDVVVAALAGVAPR